MYLFYVIQDKGRCLLLSIGIAKEAFFEKWKLFEKMDRMCRKVLSDSEKLFAVHRKPSAFKGSDDGAVWQGNGKRHCAKGDDKPYGDITRKRSEFCA